MQALSFRQAGRVPTKATKATKGTGTQRAGGSGYRKSESEALWLPGISRPDWLDGSMPGDRGFDPLGLSKPDDYVQIGIFFFGIDEQDQNMAQNVKGAVEGFLQPDRTTITTNKFAPYEEVFGLQRFKENELIHGRWCMLARLGCVVAEASTGVSWVDAGKVELDGASFIGLTLPFDLTQLVIIETLLVSTIEFYRNDELDPELRLYPGGPFDPLGLTDKSEEQTFRLKTAEIKHGRLAMALAIGEGAVSSLAKFANSL
eukprot:gene29637-5037_t